jgi:pimeloyl-ACP methyl ester carboxylesterase
MAQLRVARVSLTTAAAALALACAPAAAAAAGGHARHGRLAEATPLQWQACDGDFQCATATVPRDYAHPNGPSLQLALVRHLATDPADRLGSLFVNPGGPGGSGVDLVLGEGEDGLAPLNRRYDLVGFDPRGVGASQPAVRCLTDAEAQTQFDGPLPSFDTTPLAQAVQWASTWDDRCVERNPGLLPYLSTANVARDLDRLRAAVGDAKLTYVGFSYGTFLGATYASMFPGHVGRFVLDGPVDPDVWVNRPLQATQEQLAGFEHELQRFFAACLREQFCRYAGASDPETAFDDLVAQLDAHPVLPDPPDARPVTGDTALQAAAYVLDSKPLWPLLAGGLLQAQRGRGTLLRGLADLYWGTDPDLGYDGFWDRNLAISALDQRFPQRLGAYVAAARHSAAMFPHFGWASGYLELPWGLWPVRPKGVYRGPFRMPAEAPPALVVGTTYDPSTPYSWAKRLTAELGNARLLTMVGDGHTAFLNFSSCVVNLVTQYVDDGDVPAAGTRCPQDLSPTAAAAPLTLSPL